MLSRWLIEGKGDEGASMHKAGAVLSMFVDVVSDRLGRCFTFDAWSTSYLESELPEKLNKSMLV